MSGHPMFKAHLDEFWALHQSKAGDYGTSADPLANMRDLAEFGLPEWWLPAFRIGEKMRRVRSYIRNGSLNHDSIEDDLKDIACLSNIALILYREKQDIEAKTVLDGHSIPVPISEK